MPRRTPDPTKAFEEERKKSIQKQGSNKKLKKLGMKFMIDSLKSRYSYNFDWLGRPIIQHPQDIVAFQELIWQVQPDLIIETGIAHGGSVIMSASVLELIGRPAKVVAIDIDIRKHNRREIEKHRMFKLGRIVLIEGSSIAPDIMRRVKSLAKGKKRVLIFLDSSHAHAHVLKELELYSPLVSKGSYIVVGDTIVEYMAKGAVKDRPWGKGSNPYTATQKFLKKNKRFKNDETWEHRLLVTAAPGGFLKRVR